MVTANAAPANSLDRPVTEKKAAAPAIDKAERPRSIVRSFILGNVYKFLNFL